MALGHRSTCWRRARRAARPRDQRAPEEYDALAKLANNENPYGPSEVVIKAMTKAFKYANRYGYPDGDVLDAIAKHHDVPTNSPDRRRLGRDPRRRLHGVPAGRQEDRRVRSVVRVLYQHASGLQGGHDPDPAAGRLSPGHRGDDPRRQKNYRDVGFVYLCNPNNPTGRIVTKDEIEQLLDGIPEDVPVLIDEAYHHFVDDPAYATSIPYVNEGRAGDHRAHVLEDRRRSPACASATRWRRATAGGAAPVRHGQRQRLRAVGRRRGARRQGVRGEGEAGDDRAAQEDDAELKTLGYESIPSEANFFMVHLKRPIVPVIEEFRKKGVLVGRPFPPLNEQLRVSIGTPDEMTRFMVAFREIIGPAKSASGG